MLHKTARLTALGALFLLPVIPFLVADSMFFPYIAGKAFALRIFIEIALAAWLVLALIDVEYRPKRSWILIAMTIFTVVVGLADFFGANPMRSFWSNYERMEGFITILHLVVLVFVMGSVLKTEKLWTIFWNISLGVSALICFNAYAELAKIQDDAVRLAATFGNSTYLAVYLLFHIFIALVFLYRTRRTKAYSIAYMLLLALQLPILYYTGTRGTLLGIVGGLILSALLILLFGKEHPRMRKIAGGGLLLVCIAVGAFFALRTTSFVTESPTLSRFARISLEDSTVQSRLILWGKIVVPAFKEHPLLGWGQDNFIIAFGKYYDPGMYGQEPWFDRAHNVFLDWLVAGGALGFISYLLLFGIGIWTLWRLQYSIIEKALLTGLFAGYFVHNVFVFDNLVSYLFFMALLAWIHAESVKKENLAIGGASVSRTTTYTVGGIILVLLVWSLVSLNVHEISRSRTLIGAIKAEQFDRNYGEAFVLYSDLLSSGTLGVYEIREQFSQAVIRAYASAPTEPSVLEMRDMAEKELLKSMNDDPEGTRALSFQGFLTARTGQYEKAVGYLTDALAINETRQIFLYDLADAYGALGRTDDALATYKKSYDVDTRNERALGYYAGTLMLLGRRAEGEALLMERLGTTTIDNEAVISAYTKGGQYEKIIEIYKTRIAVGEGTPQTYVSLALTQLELELRSDAVATLREAIAKYEGSSFIPQLQQMVEAIQAGKNVKVK